MVLNLLEGRSSGGGGLCVRKGGGEACPTHPFLTRNDAAENDLYFFFVVVLVFVFFMEECTAFFCGFVFYI